MKPCMISIMYKYIEVTWFRLDNLIYNLQTYLLAFHSLPPFGASKLKSRSRRIRSLKKLSRDQKGLMTVWLTASANISKKPGSITLKFSQDFYSMWRHETQPVYFVSLRPESEEAKLQFLDTTKSRNFPGSSNINCFLNLFGLIEQNTD